MEREGIIEHSHKLKLELQRGNPQRYPGLESGGSSASFSR